MTAMKSKQEKIMVGGVTTTQETALKGIVASGSLRTLALEHVWRNL